jgi:large subunit ribosomal protein L25
MANQNLAAEMREVSGTKECRRLRSEGKTPAVIYGRGKGTLSLSVDADELQRLVSGDAHVLDLSLGSDVENVVIKSLQRDYLHDSLLHVDFERIAMDEEISASVSIETKGESIGVVQDQGILQFAHREVEVIALPANIPSSLVVDISGLQINDMIHVKDIEMPEGVRTEVDPEGVIIHVSPPRMLEEEEETEGEDLAQAEPELIRPEGRKEEEEEEEEN